jgi:3-oxoacyl-[acyl-carrier-protein] synthase II
MERRVVVTGMGCVTPLGSDLDSTWCGMVNGRSGVGAISRFDASRLASRIAGECRDFDPASVLNTRDLRHMDRFQHMAYASAIEALRRACFTVTPENAERTGVMLGSGVGGIQTIIDGCTTLAERGPGRVSPFFITKMAINLGPGHISIMLGAQGPNFSTVSACASSGHAIGEAAEVIRRDQADVMLAGGSEAGIVELAMAGFCNMRALSTRNGEPERASRPFDADRDGFVMAEGAAMLVLEELEYARARHAPILAEVAGYGMGADAVHITDPAPGGAGAARAMRQALHRAGLDPQDVQYINAHGTSTLVGDRAETAAIKEVFGDHARQLAVSSTKSMTGHCVGAAGAIESMVCVQAIVHGIAPPTINLDVPDPECDLDYVPNAGRRMPIETALNNSFGFGGQNSTLIFRALDA